MPWLAAALALRDVQLPPAPPFWPPPPAVLVLCVCVLLAGLLRVVWCVRRRQRLHALAREFDARLPAMATGADQVIGMAELLRRAASLRHPAAATLQGEDWLQWLDGQGGHGFSQGPGRLLLDGGYRPEVDPQAVARLRQVARRCYAQLRLDAGA